MRIVDQGACTGSCAEAAGTFSSPSVAGGSTGCVKPGKEDPVEEPLHCDTCLTRV
jgi:hypothetical protein